MNDSRLRHLFNRAVTDVTFRDKLFGNLCEVLLAHGVEEELIGLIEAHKPRDIQALAVVLETIDEKTS